MDRAEPEKGLESGHRSASSVVAEDEVGPQLPMPEKGEQGGVGTEGWTRPTGIAPDAITVSIEHHGKNDA